MRTRRSGSCAPSAFMIPAATGISPGFSAAADTGRASDAARSCMLSGHRCQLNSTEQQQDSDASKQRFSTCSTICACLPSKLGVACESSTETPAFSMHQMLLGLRPVDAAPSSPPASESVVADTSRRCEKGKPHRNHCCDWTGKASIDAHRTQWSYIYNPASGFCSRIVGSIVASA